VCGERSLNGCAQRGSIISSSAKATIIGRPVGRWLVASRGPGGAVCNLADAQLLRLAAELTGPGRAAVGRLES